MPNPYLYCPAHPDAADIDPLAWHYNGAVLELADLPPFDPGAIHRDEWTLWRYAALLPVQRRVALGEGMTPITRVHLPGYGSFTAKLDQLNPTGSYKDRGTTVLVNQLLAHDAQEVVEESSGNAGSSLAAYASAAGIRARIYAPEAAPQGKKRQIRLSAELVEVPGAKQNTTDACMAAAKTAVFASHAWSPYFIAGQMTCGWELWEQLGRRAPDAIVTPVGHGGLFLGIYRAFVQLHAAGLVSRVPRMIAAQSAGSDPFVQAWEQHLAAPVTLTPGKTVADGIIVPQPVRGQAVLEAIYASEGAALREDNDAILAAQTALARAGLLVEPTSATAAAVLPQVFAHLGTPAAEVVVVMTGHGLKTLA